MEYQLGNKVVVTVAAKRREEFLPAVKYLLETFPYSRLTNLDIKFVNKDYITVNANADYSSTNLLPEHNYFEGSIRVSYGLRCKGDPSIVNRLFHEYKHLLQDDAGYLYAPEPTPNHCNEAQAWADEQEPIYRKWLDA